MRVAEIMNDYRNVQNYIAGIRANPSSEEYNEDGYVVLRRCVSEAQALLAQPFAAQNGSTGDPEQDKMNLRRSVVFLTSSPRLKLGGGIEENDIDSGYSQDHRRCRNPPLQSPEDLPPCCRGAAMGQFAESSASGSECWW